MTKHQYIMVTKHHFEVYDLGLCTVCDPYNEDTGV